MRDASKGIYSNAVVLRRYGVNLRESVYEQIGWAINALGVSELWHGSVSPMSYTFTPTGQKIVFRGVDDPTKVKSIKFSKGWAKYLWYEECVEFEGEEKLRNINQSVLRGGADFFAFYSFNPPKAARNWVNQYVAIEREDTLVHHSTYLTVPPEWLGEQFQKPVKIVRTMPNTPALVGEGMTAACPNAYVTEDEKKYALELLGSFGKVEVVPEHLIDAVVAVSGSSPAYVFLLIEAMADAAVAEGMPRQQAYQFAAQAVYGSAKMVLETGKHPGELKDMVCSPAGTTIEAVRVLEEKGLRSAVIEAMKACAEVSRNL